MATLSITLPDDLARDLADEGLWNVSAIETALRDRLRTARVADLRAVRVLLEANPPEAMSSQEINAEIAAYRVERRRASGA